MSYVKNYNVGKIQLDLPTPNYFHELPLLSFGDIHGSVNLSLVFNYGMKEEGSNPFGIAAGYKLNLQKRLIMSDGVPSAFQGENGKIINLNRTGDVYAFDDDTQRIMRKTINNTYEIENPDFSKDIFNSSGRITGVLDKYGVPVLSYSYNTSTRLTSIGYRGKSIIFTYDGQNRLSVIKYKGKQIELNYGSVSNGIQLAHYNGVTFTLTSAGINFTATENSKSISYSTKINKNNDNTLVISDFINQENVNTTTYKFPGLVTSYNTNFLNVEITDNNGVTKRIQFKDKKPLYSYEIGASDVEFINEKYSGKVQIYNVFNDRSIFNTGGVQGVYDGYPLTKVDASTEVSWEAELSSLDEYKGFYTLSGWIKLLDDNYASDTIPLHIAKNIHTITYSQYLPKPPVNQWSYFYITFPWDESSVSAYIKKHHGNIETKDFRLGFQSTHVLSDDDSTYVPMSEEVLIYHGGATPECVSIVGSKFVCGDLDISSYGRVCYEDLLKYKTNQRRDRNLTEFYCDKLRTVLITSSSSPIIVTDDSNTYSYNLSECYLGKRSYTKKGIMITRLRDDVLGTSFVIETLDKINT